MTEEVLRVNVEELYESAAAYLDIICGLQRKGKMAARSRQLAEEIKNELFNGTQLEVLMQRFGRDEIEPEGFNFAGQRIACSSLKTVSRQHILAGYAVLLRSPMPDISQLPVSKMYLADSWETSLVDAGRDYLRPWLLERETERLGQELYISDTLAPGMAGMPSDCIRSFFGFMDGSRVGVSLTRSGMMNPVKSFVGIYLLLDRQEVIRTANCGECASQGKTCAYCKDFAQRHFGGDFEPELQRADKTLLGQWRS
ncbi:MAG: hypothetical protein Q4D07_00710 [Selenomonadaceae bacterium]|nr:hypothetical protein [Selenomonadaceae bacterium]